MTSWPEFVSTLKFSAEIAPDCAITPLSDFGMIRVSGPEARTFLQGQTTNDVHQVDAQHTQLNSICSPKGRMLAIFRVLQRADDLYLLMPRERVEPTLKRLQMFVLRSKVELADVSGELAVVCLSGDCAADLLPLDPPADDYASVTQDDITIIRLPGDRPRFQVILEVDFAIDCWQETVQSATPVRNTFWSLMDIRAGLPWVYDDTVEAFVPQMANLQLVDGVSFTKGCYTGQEIVARMQYLGTLKRRMYRVRTDAGQAPQRGMALFSSSSDSGQGAGRIVDAAPSPDGGYEALAVIRISSAEADDLRLGDANGPPVRLEALPYSFDAA